jgi:hypothetical protein
MLQLIFKIIFISIILYLLFENLLINNNIIEPLNSKNRNETALNMTNRNAGKIQFMKEELDTIKKELNGLKPMEKYANTHSKDIQLLITNKKAREAQEKISE